MSKSYITGNKNGMKRTFVIGDIHGCYDEFIQLIEKIGITEDDFIVSLGDIVDRGNKSLELYHFFKNRKNSKVLIGNHERKHLNGGLSYAQEIVKVQFADEYDEFLEWLDKLEYYHETDCAIVVHAFFEHDKELKNQKEEVLAGTTSGTRHLDNKYEDGKYWSDYYKGSKPIIYGHHVVGAEPKIIGKTYGIDTGACHGGMLTAIELPNFKVHQIAVDRDYWKEEQSKWQIPVLEAKDWEGMRIQQVYRQIEKLDYKKEAVVVEFLRRLKIWMEQVELTFEKLKTEIEKTTERLIVEHRDNFNQEVSKMELRTYLFKAKGGNLTIVDLKNHLDTPGKVIELAERLKLDRIPNRKADS